MRIKILARLRTDEHRAAQDGKLMFRVDNNEKIDARVSIVPVVYGEKQFCVCFQKRHRSMI